MRKFISGLLAIAAAAFTGCYESGTDADNTSREARISISPAAIGFDADGRLRRSGVFDAQPGL